MVFVLQIIVCMMFCFFFFKQKTAYEMRISDWSSDVCSYDLNHRQYQSFNQVRSRIDQRQEAQQPDNALHDLIQAREEHRLPAGKQPGHLENDDGSAENSRRIVSDPRQPRHRLYRRQPEMQSQTPDKKTK